MLLGVAMLFCMLDLLQLQLLSPRLMLQPPLSSLLLLFNHAKTSIPGTILKRKFLIAKRWRRDGNAAIGGTVNLDIKEDGDW